jgi:hypothetical protein
MFLYTSSSLVPPPQGFTIKHQEKEKKKKNPAM